MGAAASTLTPEQSAQIAEKLKSSMASFQSANLPDDVIQSKMTEEYNKLVQELTAPKRRTSKDNIKIDKSPRNSLRAASPKHNDNLTNIVNNRLHGNNNTSKAPTTKSNAPRRRSFDTSQNDKKAVSSNPIVHISTGIASAADAGAATLCIESANTGQPETTAAAIDSWDSVSQQPFCKICQMAFKSEGFLERHIKFSDLHKTNESKKLSAGILASASVPALTSVDIGKFATQVEGQHYKLLYGGSKFFWRTKENIDLHFYHHILPHAIEVIGYDVAVAKELNRIYLNYDRILSMAKKLIPADSDEADEETIRTSVTTFILQRIQLQASPGVGVTSNNTLIFAKLSGDANETSAIIEKPIVLIPIPITRRRRTNTEEIEATMHSLSNDRIALAEATKRAERIAGLVYSSASAIAGKKWWADFNPVRRKWIWAIRRVIRQKLVAETKQMLQQRQKVKDAATRESKSNARPKEI
jgi:hypothetical protein